MTDFPDEPTNPEARAPMPKEVVKHIEDYAAAMRHFKRPEDVIAAADALVAFAKGGAP